MKIGPIEISWVGFHKPEWKTLARADLRIAAIKLYRETHGMCSLDRAKRVVDDFRIKIGKKD